MNTELGPLISEHKGRLAAGGIGWYIGAILFAASTVGLVKAIASGELGDVLYMLVGATVAALGLLWLYSKWKQSITIHQRGFVLYRFMRAPRIIPFAHVTEVDVHRTASRHSLHLKGLHVRLGLTLQSGERLVVTNDIAEIEQLAMYAQPGGPSAGGPGQGGASARRAGEVNPWG